MDTKATSSIVRTQPENRAAAKTELAKAVLARVVAAHRYWAPQFNRMAADATFAAGEQNFGKVQQTAAANLQVQANITRAVISGIVARLYAKDPTVVPRRVERMDAITWDGTAAMLEEAKTALRYFETLQIAQSDPMGAAPMPPASDAPLMDQMTATQVLSEAQAVRARKLQVDRVGQVAKLLIQHFWERPRPNFKLLLQEALRRAETTGVAYCRPTYRREFKPAPEVSGRIASATERVAALKARIADAQDGELHDETAEMQALEVQLKQLETEQYTMAFSGLEFRFPASTNIIPDTRMRSLLGFQGCEEVAECYPMSRDQIKHVYGVDLPSSATPAKLPATVATTETAATLNSAVSATLGVGAKRRRDAFNVYEVWNITDGTVATVCDGYEGFLVEPTVPADVREGFWPWDAYIPYPVESDSAGQLWPLSCVQLIRALQAEINRLMEALRQHRIANRPGMVTRRGALRKEDKRELATHIDHKIIELEGLGSGEDIRSVLQPKPTVPIDPKLYDTTELFALIQRVVGVQQADLGYISGGTATEASIAAGGRASEDTARRDALDEFLSAVVRGAGELLLLNADLYTVQRIAGAGATWPQTPEEAEAFRSEVTLTIRAGSSGQPNKAETLAALERMAPYIMQMPNLDPTKIVELMLRTLLGDEVEMADYLKPDSPSIVSLNRMSGQLGGAVDPMADPSMQGERGGERGPTGEQPQGGPQALMPAPGTAPVTVPIDLLN